MSTLTMANFISAGLVLFGCLLAYPEMPPKVRRVGWPIAVLGIAAELFLLVFILVHQ